MLISKLTSDQASRLIGKIDTIIIPVGTIEPHGPHCSVLCDAIIPQRLAEEVDKIAGDRIFVGPCIPYGHTWELRDLPGAHYVPREAFTNYVFEVIKGFQKWGIKYVILLNGHGSVGFGSGGNIEPLHAAAQRATELGIKTLVLLWCFDTEALKGITGDVDGHAGEAETSILWYYGDEYLDRKIIPGEHGYYSAKTAVTLNDAFDQKLNPTIWPRAYWGTPNKASPEKGKQLSEKLARCLVEAIDALRSDSLFSPYHPEPPKD